VKAIIIGAGRGIRLMPTTADTPKCFAMVGSRRILDWTIEALTAAGIERIAFIGGYQIDQVRAEYPHFAFYHNDRWQTNNILASLMYAEPEMDEPFVCCYSDILFTPRVVAKLLAAKGDISLAVDTDWQSRYSVRSEHPVEEAEKVMVADGHITEIGRQVRSEAAYGEYIGVARFSAAGARTLREHYHRAREQFAGKPFGGARSFETAYLVQLFQHMVALGVRLAHVDTHGEYLEIDTQQDFDYARQHWR